MSVRIEAPYLRNWHLALRGRLSQSGEACFTRPGLQSAGSRLPTSVSLLLQIESLFGRAPNSLFDEIPDVAAEEHPSEFDLIIDCSPTPKLGQAGLPRRLVPLFDGNPGELALLEALLERRMPVMQVVDATTLQVKAEGQSSSESTATLTAALDSVLSRLIELLVEATQTRRPGIVGNHAWPQGPSGVKRLPMCAYLFKRVASSAARRLYHVCCDAPHWKVGWRISDETTAFDVGHLGGAPWTVLPDDGSFFCADPFPVTWNGRTIIYFELVDHKRGPSSGMIAGVEVDTVTGRLKGNYFRVLEGPSHLSYPFVFAHKGTLWMIPESSLSGQVVLYRCVDFPRTWVPEVVLIDGIEAADPTIFYHECKFWMMSSIRHQKGGYSDMLAIHHADTLTGPWHEHRRCPVLIDAAASRPAGRIFTKDGMLVRPVQNCRHTYGRSIAFLRIDKLTSHDYQQSHLRNLIPNSSWSGGRVHTWNHAGSLECIDGIRFSPKLRRYLSKKMMVDPVGDEQVEHPMPNSTQGRGAA